MKSRKYIPIRYQLKKEGALAVKRGHPWIFRDQLSTAASQFKTGQWLKLCDIDNLILGYGIFDTDGIIAIRVIKPGKKEVTTEWLTEKIDKALAKRVNVRKYTNAYRAIHGENDGFPGVVIDVYDDTMILQTYANCIDTLGRYVSAVVGKKLGIKNILWKMPSKRQNASTAEGFRILKGHCPNTISFREGEMTLTVEPKTGQKSGAFLDLRGLRKYVSMQKLNGARVLNLFAYTGTLGLAAEKAGANEIWNLDISQGALDTAKKYHATKPDKHRFMAEDIFEWFQSLPTKEKFDLIIIDPPQMASRMSQVQQALRVYSKLYSKAREHLKPKGKIVGACCSSRITRKDFDRELRKALVPPLKFKTSLLSEEDHPVTFNEGDYLKILVFENK